MEMRGESVTAPRAARTIHIHKEVSISRHFLPILLRDIVQQYRSTLFYTLLAVPVFSPFDSYPRFLSPHVKQDALLSFFSPPRRRGHRRPIGIRAAISASIYRNSPFRLRTLEWKRRS